MQKGGPQGPPFSFGVAPHRRFAAHARQTIADGMKRSFGERFRALGSGALRPRIGALAGALALGMVAVGFARAGEAAQALFGRLVAIYPYAPLIVTPLVFAAAAEVTRRHFSAARGSGIPQVMAAAHDPARQAAGLLA